MNVTENDLFNTVTYAKYLCMDLQTENELNSFKHNRLAELKKRLVNILTAFEFNNQDIGDSDGYKLKDK